MYSERIRLASLHDKVMSAAEAASLIKDGMTVGMSGFACAGDAKAVPFALVERTGHEPLSISLITGASIGNGLDKLMAEAGLLARRMPFQADPALRKAITEDGHIVPTASVGNSANLALFADQVIVEISLRYGANLEGLHDIYIPPERPERSPIPLVRPDQRIGATAIPIDPAKIAAIVISEYSDSPSNVLPPDGETQAIADHLIGFFANEVEAGRLPRNLGPLQVGVGSIANAVMAGLVDAPFENLSMYSEVLQDSTFELFDAGKLDFASGSSIVLSAARGAQVFGDFERYKERLVLRPQEISNHPEVARRLGIIGINTALEFDLYGNVNSTHVGGTRMMNGIGGSGDFARNAQLAIFVTKSIAKDGAISSVVPMVSHVDHTEHDVDILVTEQGLADLRGLAPRERARAIIDNCVHPEYRAALEDYFARACERGGQTPHVLEEALSWHINQERRGHMLTTA
ncbi:acetyl-CoA hydrolase/transferase C-terminal domain-containing protein [Azotobacter chroococcum]|uniref:Acetyl-CoA hydrolase/transferase family protein n=1 Tax=Azotobacter chroococcum NCIMB 8003 TaxID=1328314 RepID=A0A0C4WNF0_9GAMM|nr:acetyl-CoA hydrolase/transferase C-terminal domain-containing protein [Azotobacter chroococcum]AJE22061.1 Acetyl-CoA hydrolase/transferase family protein [Azotobacter chroococcum NCIMB 8003]